jgi:hypothetical protein
MESKLISIYYWMLLGNSWRRFPKGALPQRREICPDKKRSRLLEPILTPLTLWKTRRLKPGLHSGDASSAF